jgi:hypothetical protein
LTPLRAPAEKATPAGAATFRLFFSLVPGGGVEPPRPCDRRILSPLRLPVPPSRRILQASILLASKAIKYSNLSPHLSGAPVHSLPCSTAPAAFPLFRDPDSELNELYLSSLFIVRCLYNSATVRISIPAIASRESKPIHLHAPLAWVRPGRSQTELPMSLYHG